MAMFVSNPGALGAYNVIAMPGVEERLKSWALEEGFDRVGVARLTVSEQVDALDAWLARGDHAGMTWMERRRELRQRPEELLPGARSALCVALQYHPIDGEKEPEGDLWPWVARYAHGEDYHLLMGDSLRRLAARIEAAYPGSGTRAYVDTGPILERELAARAGLGAIGKNTNLLHPEGGSWFLLGELLLTLDLEADTRYEDLCGSCTACLDACPTGALPEPYRLDSRRCISYWTIEHRGAVPEQRRRQLGSWVFGCDICQQVCPINESAGGGSEQRLRVPEARQGLDLNALLAISREEYVELFRRSPMKRAKLGGLKRNAAIAMGNRGSKTYLPALRRALGGDEEAVVRLHAAWALGRIGGSAARESLLKALENESDEEVRAAVSAALEVTENS